MYWLTDSESEKDRNGLLWAKYNKMNSISDNYYPQDQKTQAEQIKHWYLITAFCNKVKSHGVCSFLPLQYELPPMIVSV